MERDKTKCLSLMPEHLLIGCMDDGSFPVKEARVKSGIEVASLRNSINPEKETSCGVVSEPFHTHVTCSTKRVLDVSVSYMHSYKQVYLNEGHVIKALIKTGMTSGLLTQEQNKALMDIAVVSRDMLMDLSAYFTPDLPFRNIRKVVKKDTENLIRFIEGEFKGNWTDSIKISLSKTLIPIFIATDSSGSIVGFAAYNPNGHFGPMGVALNRRSEGIGQSLLHSCLGEMKVKGYREVIIDSAGPIEFYERTCNAEVVPVD
ncbi:GNAT family N-acetyltransferase [Mesobacillus jeotgali]|uniref:GNAT family N-acetyltransferase n=1 Tax=Mesobacillus jeotgali TaxID=129985 RepID=UPI0011161F22|nr:GNAT family N-acetyltransferase [Mesobacillus jeotgali]